MGVFSALALRFGTSDFVWCWHSSCKQVPVKPKLGQNRELSSDRRQPVYLR
jgi:hypothetical protein